MKDIAPELLTAMQGEVTTLCSCILIRRRDAKSYYFTDHDEPVTVEEKRYLPYHSFARTSIPTSIELEVDTSEFHAMLNSDAVVAEDVRAGLFDNAEVELFFCDYKHPEYGRLEIRTGWMGEVQTREDGTYTAEIRGLTQILAQRVGEAYSPECRADLGDKRCKVAVNPPRWEPNRRYAEGEIVLGKVDTISGASINLAFTNMSFDLDTVSPPVLAAPQGWTGYGHPGFGWAIKSGAYAGLAGGKKGAKYAVASKRSGSPGNIGMHQEIWLPGQGVDDEAIDTGQCRFWMETWVAQLQTDKVWWRISVIAYQDNGANPQTIYDSTLLRTAEDRWVRNVVNNVIIPPLTRHIGIDFFSSKKPGDEAGTAFDGIKAVVNYPNGQFEGNAEFAGVAFLALNDGTSGDVEPTFSGVIDDETVDNTVTWKTIRSFRSATLAVDSIVSQRSVFFDYLDEPSDTYEGGLLKWETGLNAGHSYEIMTQTNNQVTTFQRPFYPIQEGDTAVLFPGCDKRFPTCVTVYDNAINFRGEPHVPGQDEYYKTPNAHLEEL